jgi:hypothetical protein
MGKTRRFVLSCLAGASGLPLLLRSGPGFAALENHERLAATLRCLVDDPRRARALGERYRAQFPEEAPAGVLTSLIGASLGLSGCSAAPVPRDALRALMDARVRAEFGAGDVVRVGGWVLARTEARLCALCD